MPVGPVTVLLCREWFTPGGGRGGGVPRGVHPWGTPPPYVDAGRVTADLKVRCGRLSAQERASGLGRARRVRVGREPPGEAGWRYCVFGRSRPVHRTRQRRVLQTVG